MAPSTVFSYWRRDNRRSSASPVPPAQPASKDAQSASKAPVADSPPQLPQIPNTPTLETTIGGSPVIADAQDAQPSGEASPVLDAAKPSASECSPNGPSSSSTNLAVPPPSDRQSRPHSSPEERVRDPVRATQSNHPRLSLNPQRHDNGDGDSYKPSSPFRLSFGKGLLNTQAQPADTGKRSSTPGMAPTGHSKFKPSLPDDSPGDKPAVLQRDNKLDRTHSRRYADRDSFAESPHHKPGKAMLHLLNPMSLLAKRRSSQLVGPRAEDTRIGARSVVPAIPEDYDPRIRGNIVHDFSAPRPRRNLSATPSLLWDDNNQSNTRPPTRNEPGAEPGTDDPPSNQPTDQKKRRSEHSPVFKEHFDDDNRALQVEHKAYLQSPLLVNSHSHDDEGSVPAFAKKLPSRLPDSSEKTIDHHAADSNASSGQPNGDLPEKQEQDADVVEKVPQLSSGFPKHFKSNASRFSFDMNAVESSTQEKLLEEKHKEKEAARKADSQFDGEFSDVNDDYENIMDDVDDLEEKIPGVNVDADEEDDGNVPGAGDIMDKSWFTPGLSPVIASPSSPAGSNLATNSTSNREQAQSSGAETTENPSKNQSYTPSLYDTSAQEDQVNTPPQDSNGPGPTVNSAQTPGAMNPGVPQPFDDDDDIYFDDGEFGDLGDLGDDVGGEKFDESIFDDETSHLYDRKPPAERLQPRRPEEGSRPDASRENDDPVEKPAEEPGLKHVPSMASEFQTAPSINYGHSSERIPKMGSIKSRGGVLTENNLEALHVALAKAANDAASTSCVSERSPGQESAAQTVDSHPGLVSDDSRLSQAIDTLGVDEPFEDLNHDDDDNALYDDPIIAAANAEALENDDEGFYGEEFGFYAQANGGCSAQLTNGGYFGPRGVEGIARNYSTRSKFREPSLTPITERSEWSTRNSVISMTAHGAAHSNPSLSSPGLAQLVDMGNIDDEMSLSALMRLRRGAFGGSNGSLRSSSGSPPPRPHSSSNRGSFTGLSDVSPTGLDSKIPNEWPTTDPDKEKSPTGVCADDE